jgi:ADP-ribose 1''-phosphate phosphatase
MTIKYENGDLLDQTGSILVHAGNALGVWGAGIARQFALRFPLAYQQYRQQRCCVGEAVLVPVSDTLVIATLITSSSHGARRDAPDTILANTRTALESLLRQLPRHCSGTALGLSLRSNRFNSGLFGVPWHRTEEVLQAVTHDLDWTVHSGT